MPVGPKTWSAEDVEVTRLEQQIARMWKELSGPDPGAHPIRTHIFNLVVYTPSSEEGWEIVARLEALNRYHPSRTIVLIGDRMHSTTSIDAEVTVQCDSGLPGAPSGCHERLVLTVRGRAADHMASVVLPLLLPEIPTYLWSPGQPLFGHRMFHRLLAAADQLVVDSARFESPGDGIASLATLASGRTGINDFCWARLTPWRDLIAQFFDSPNMCPYVHGIESIELELGAATGASRAVESTILLLLGWMASRLGWRPETTLDRAAGRDLQLAVLDGQRLIPIQITFSERGRNAAGELMRVRLDARLEDRPPATFEIVRDSGLDHVRATTDVEGECNLDRYVPLTTISDVELLADELEVTGKDALFTEVLHAASRLAGREIWEAAS